MIRRYFFVAALTGSLAGFLLGWPVPAVAEPLDVDSVQKPSGGQEGQIEEVSEAATRFKNRDFGGALELLETAKQQNPQLPPARVIMGQWFLQANQPQAARAFLEQGALRNDQDPEAYLILGDLCLRENRRVEAILLYEEAAELAEKFKGDAQRRNLLQQRAKAGLAIASEMRGDWESARKHLEAWLAEDPDNASALQRLGRTLFELGEINLALEKLQAAAESSESTIAPEAIIAQYFEQAGDREKSTEWMIRALKNKPKDLQTRLAAVQWAIGVDQLDQAAEQAKLALQLDSDSLQAKLLRGVVALLQEDYPTAEQMFQQVHNQEPGNFAASNNLALALIEQDDESKQSRALQYAQLNARQFPNVAEAASTLGWILYKLDRKQEAEQALRKAFSGGNVSPDTRYYMAKLYADTDREEEAKQLLQQALESERTFSKRAEAEALLEQLNQ